MCTSSSFKLLFDNTPPASCTCVPIPCVRSKKNAQVISLAKYNIYCSFWYVLCVLWGDPSLTLDVYPQYKFITQDEGIAAEDIFCRRYRLYMYKVSVLWVYTWLHSLTNGNSIALLVLYKPIVHSQVTLCNVACTTHLLTGYGLMAVTILAITNSYLYILSKMDGHTWLWSGLSYI